MNLHPVRSKLVDHFDLDEDQARSVVACVAVLIAVGICGLIWDSRAVVAVLLIAVLFLIVDRAALRARVDEAHDRADLAHGRADAIENHLTGLQPAGRGRHADSAPPAPAPAPAPTRTVP